MDVRRDAVNPSQTTIQGVESELTLIYSLCVSTRDGGLTIYTKHIFWQVDATSPTYTLTVCSECQPDLFSRDSQSLCMNELSGVRAIASKTLR